jgi:hypothetical protein
MRSRANVLFESRALTVFLALVLFQGFHELEHITQVVQIYVLGIANGAGLVGSLVNVEPLHFAYNTLYLGLLIAVYVLLGLHEDGPRAVGPVVTALVTFALAFQMWHELEHVFKLVQFFALGVNGTGGIFGQGPGAVFPLVPISVLHLAYNTVAYVPALAAFLMVSRQSAGERITRHSVVGSA